MNWQRWPAATIETATLVVETLEPDGSWGATRQERGLVAYRGRRDGSAYTLAPHGAAWRQLGDAMAARGDATDAAAPGASVDPLRLQRFYRSYGPLLNVGDDREAFGRGAMSMAADFSDLSQYWDAPEGQGEISRRRSDTAVGRQALVASFRLQARLASKRPPPAESLLGFLIAAALRHVRGEMPMRRCAACGCWIALTRADRMVCDAACRVARGHSADKRGRRRRMGED